MGTEEKRRTTEQIQQDAAIQREKLVDSVAQLAEELKPKNVAKNVATDAKSFVGKQFNNLKCQIVDKRGLRVNRLVAIGGAVFGLVTFIFTVRAVVNKAHGRKLLANPHKRVAAK